MIITLKNVKQNEALSEETHCFSATVYVDGKKAFGAKNAGHGGETEMYPVKGGTNYVPELLREIELELGKEKVEGYPTLNNCLDFVVSELVSQWLIDSDIKKALRKITWMAGGVMYEVKAKPTEENIALVKKKDFWNDSNVILNGLPIEEVRQYFN